MNLAELSAVDGFDPKQLTAYARQVGHGGALGVDYIDHGADWVELGLDYNEKLIGVVASGTLASGPIISLMDMATSMAVWVKLNRLCHQITLDLRIDYPRPALPGRRIIGRGECYRITKSVGFVRGLAHDGEAADPIAHVTGTFMFTNQS